MPMILPALAYAATAAVSSALVFEWAVFAVLTAISAVSMALTPKPKAIDFGSLDSGRTVMAREPKAPRQIIYGRAKVSGPILFLHQTGAGNKYIHIIIGLAGHEVEAIDTIYFDDNEVVLDGNGYATGDYAISYEGS